MWGSGWSWSWSAPVQQFCHLYAAHHHYHRFIVSGEPHRARVGVEVETGSGTETGMGGLGLRLCLCCGSLWAMWHPHAPLANDAASGSLSRKNVLIAGVGNSNGGEMLLLRIHKELIKNTKSRRSRHDNAKRDGRRYKNEEIYMPNLYLAILKPQSVCLSPCPSICPSLPLSVCGTGAVAGFCSDFYF